MLASVVPLAGCEEVNGSELMVPININVVVVFVVVEALYSGT